MFRVAFRGINYESCYLQLASGRFKAGSELFRLGNVTTPNPTQTSVWDSDRKVHVEDALVKFMNHSCDPNIMIKGSRVLALKDIQYKDELTFNYIHHEPCDLAAPFECDKCGGLIKDYNYPTSCIARFNPTYFSVTL